jgi:hypothetical protein
MQVDPAMVERYKAKAPELLDVVTTGEAEHIMRRDPTTDHCVKFESGWCGVHKKYGSDFLGDACHFFPRVTRSIGDVTLMTAALSCPEVTRLIMEHDAPFAFASAEADRLPYSLKDYLPKELSAQDALMLHQAFIHAALEDSFSAEQNMLRIGSVVRSLKVLPVMAWPKAVEFYFKNAGGRIPKAEPHPADPFNLLHAVCGLISASKKTERPRLMQTIANIENALCVKLDWQTVSIHLTPESEKAYQILLTEYEQAYKSELQPIFKKWIAAQLSVALFPFAGFGESLEDRIAVLVVRFAIMKLAVISGCVINNKLQPQDVYTAIQSLSRFLDHLSDPTLTMQICQETGWIRETRQVALVGA